MREHLLHPQFERQVPSCNQSISITSLWNKASFEIHIVKCSNVGSCKIVDGRNRVRLPIQDHFQRRWHSKGLAYGSPHSFQLAPGPPPRPSLPSLVWSSNAISQILTSHPQWRIGKCEHRSHPYVCRIAGFHSRPLPRTKYAVCLAAG